MNIYKYALALLATTLMLPAVAGCCGNRCGRRHASNRRTRVVRTAAVIIVQRTCARGGHCGR